MENNKLIAEFMGLERTEKEIGEITYKGEEKGTVIWLSHLKYHTSWDWLMPVVEKIFNHESEFISYSRCAHIRFALCEPNIKNVYSECIKVIEFYNTLPRKSLCLK